MKKIKLGILLGIIAGIIDIIPMIFQMLTWDANLSAFLFWIIVGLVISTSNITFVVGAIKGIFLSLILFIPLAIIIGVNEPLSLIPIIGMNLILGSLLGYFIERFSD